MVLFLSFLLTMKCSLYLQDHFVGFSAGPSPVDSILAILDSLEIPSGCPKVYCPAPKFEIDKVDVFVNWPLSVYLFRGSSEPTSSPTDFPSTNPSLNPTTFPTKSPSLEPSISSSPTEVSYDFESRDELVEAVDLWRTDQLLAQQTYQNPSKWNVSAIENFDHLFSASRQKGWAYYDFADLDVSNWQVSHY